MPGSGVLRRHQQPETSTSPQVGLTSAKAADRLRRFGPNELPREAPAPLWKTFLRQFNEVIIWLLLAAAAASSLMGEHADAVAILAIVILNAVLGFVQEERAGRALAALRELSAPKARVFRDGVLITLGACELVPGDRIAIEAGDRVPADARLRTSTRLSVQEAALTGEPGASEKDAGARVRPDAPLAERRNRVFLGTTVATGRGEGVVIATGARTEVGRIAGLLRQSPAEPTPLQRRLAQLGRTLIVICVVLVIVVFSVHVLRGGSLAEVFMTSVGLAVAAVPEGLPAVVTISLALGLKRMVRRHVRIRRLPAVETLGSVTVICTDKTGTLTSGRMEVRQIDAGGRTYVASDWRGAGDDLPDGMRQSLEVGQWCNNAAVREKQDGSIEAIGGPTESALLLAARKAGLNRQSDRRRLDEIPFDSHRKMMSVIILNADGRRIVYSKGAAEVLLLRCTHELLAGEVLPLNEARRHEIARASGQMASGGLRVLGLASRTLPESFGNGEVERDLVFVGLAGIVDPPRPEVKPAVESCRRAGIRPVMITGDHPDTAEAIARELGLADGPVTILTGSEIEKLLDPELAAQVRATAIYARVSPEHKLRIVRAWKSLGEIVAMTGDGVNDAPAVKAADIGIAMGLTGTDVTRECSDMVLTDDNFASIVSAVEEGRGIFDNIRKFVQYLLSCNAAEILFILVAALLGWPVPLTAVQLLWMNLVTDGLPALALGLEPPEPDVMRRPPRPPSEPVIPLREGIRILVHAAVIAAAPLAAFGMALRDSEPLPHARTIAFCVLAFCELFYAFACRSQRYTLPRLGLFSNRPLVAGVLASAALQVGTVLVPGRHASVPVLRASDWLLIIGIALVPVSVVELNKLIVHSLRWARSPRAS